MSTFSNEIYTGKHISIESCASCGKPHDDLEIRNESAGSPVDYVTCPTTGVKLLVISEKEQAFEMVQDSYSPVVAFVGRMKYSLMELQEEKDKLLGTIKGRYFAIVITDLEKLIAFTEKYLQDEQP